MSMALFLRAVTPAEAEVMSKDASMVDEIVEREGFAEPRIAAISEAR